MSLENKSILVKALIFDMDGTMIDNMMIHHHAWQNKLKELGLEMSLDEVKRDVHGVNDEILRRLFGDRFSDQEIRQIAWEKEEEYRKIYKDQIKLISGLKEFLDEAKAIGIPMGIGTAAPKENADFVLDNLNMREYFKALVHSDMVTKGKPNPEVFKKVADKLGVSLAETLIFEDSPTGARAAANGKASSLILKTTHSESEFLNISNIQGYLNDFSYCNIAKTDEKDLFRIEFQE